MILACVAAGSAVAAVVSAVKAGPEAVRIQEARKVELERLAKEKKDEKEYKKDKLYVNFETGKAYALCFAPTAGFLLLCLGSIGYGYKISAAKYATLLGAYKTLQGKHTELEKKAREVIGDKKVDNIKKLIVSDHLQETDMPEGIEWVSEEDWEKDRQGNVIAKNYPTPCFDDWGKRIFPATRSKIEKAMIKYSQRLLNGWSEFVNVTMIYRELDPEGKYLPISVATDEYGWTEDDLMWSEEYSCKIIPFVFTSIIKDEYEHPVLCLELDPKIVNLS